MPTVKGTHSSENWTKVFSYHSIADRNSAFFDIILSPLANSYQHFGESFCLNIQVYGTQD